MRVAIQKDVRPDLVRHHKHVVFPEQLHGLFQLFPLPDAAAGVVRAAEDGGVDLLVFQMLLHVGIVHPPDAVFVLDQRAVDDVVAVVLKAAGKADVGRAVDKHLAAPGADAVQRADDAAQHAVFVADVLGFQPGHAVAGILPVENRIIIRFGRVEIAVCRVLCPCDDGLRDGRHGGEVHIRHPHGDRVEALLGGRGCKAGAQTVHRDRILAAAVHQGGKIVFHGSSSCFSLQKRLPPKRKPVASGKISPR